ncbi:MAG TPA: glycosyltransferase [Solirubrobacterales bacterium]|nr:glycosyltransferase [Solirubrobacterales bacterium]
MSSSGIAAGVEAARADELAANAGMRPLAAMLAADVVAIHFEGPADREPTLAIELDGVPVELDLHVRSHATASEERLGRLLVGVFSGGRPSGDATLALDGAEATLGPAPLAQLCVDLRSLLRERLAPLPSDARLAIQELLCDVAAGEAASVDPLALSTSMALAREGLRDPLPPCRVERDEPQGLHFDSIVSLSERSFYLRGWAVDSQAELARLTVVTPEGERVELLPSIHRNPRPDVDSFYELPSRSARAQTGIIGYFETRAPSYAASGWVLEMENELGVGREVEGPAVSRDLLGARAGILSDLHKETRWDCPLMDQVVPAVSRIQEALDEGTTIEDVHQFGDPPPDPEASVVVPLYGRIDFLEQQIAQFVHDPELVESDLIYVLDSPELAPALETAASELFELYGVPFRTAVLSANGGYSVANNRGASLARGRMLLLLNSDVLPERPGWLSRMTEFYDGKDEIGALGPKLLFEDDTLQHAGIRFQRPPGGGAWGNEHFFKGLHRDLPAANLSRPVPAVSGACLMIDRGLYEEVGGLRGLYVQGDYEDTDLCLRLREAGRESWYLPEVELYHLEGQSYALETRHAMSRYNVWLHSRLWDAEIERLTSS